MFAINSPQPGFERIVHYRMGFIGERVADDRARARHAFERPFSFGRRTNLTEAEDWSVACEAAFNVSSSALTLIIRGAADG
jgi:hypothetical protein